MTDSPSPPASSSPLSAQSLIITPDPDSDRLTRPFVGLDHRGREITLQTVTERALTLYLNSQEIMTIMTIGDYPEYLGVGYLRNQNLLLEDDIVSGVDYDDDLGVIVVRTERPTRFEARMKRTIRTSGCAQGTIFADVMDGFAQRKLPHAEGMMTQDNLLALTRMLPTIPSLYLKAGAIHGCVLCQGNTPLLYIEDVGRHNAVDKIAGYMFTHKISPHDKILYTTGRLTSEMVIKTVMMGIPVLVSRSGFTAFGVELAQERGLTLIARARGLRFLLLSAPWRFSYNADAK